MHKNLREITDKDLIVFLVACNFQIQKIEKDKKYNRSLVYFEDSEKLEEYILRFTNKSIDINICDYMAAEKRVKTLLCIQKNK